MIAACLFGLVLGLVAGSFIAALTIRWPIGVSISHGRSRCDSCEQVLPARQLVPIISYIALSGRCAFCGAAISSRHLAVEIACGAIGVLALGVSPDVAGLSGAVFGWGLLALALLDAKHLWLPDALTLPLALVGLVAGAAGIGPSVPVRLMAAAVGIFSFLLIGIAYRLMRGRAGLGQGDAKLMGAIGAWLGWAPLPLVIVGAGLVGLGWIVIVRLRQRPITVSSHLPLGTFLALSAWLIWLSEAVLSRLSLPIAF